MHTQTTQEVSRARVCVCVCVWPRKGTRLREREWAHINIRREERREEEEGKAKQRGNCHISKHQTARKITSETAHSTCHRSRILPEHRVFGNGNVHSTSSVRNRRHCCNMQHAVVMVSMRSVRKRTQRSLSEKDRDARHRIQNGRMLFKYRYSRVEHHVREPPPPRR